MGDSVAPPAVMLPAPFSIQLYAAAGLLPMPLTIAVFMVDGLRGSWTTVPLTRASSPSGVDATSVTVGELPRQAAPPEGPTRRSSPTPAAAPGCPYSVSKGKNRDC